MGLSYECFDEKFFELVDVEQELRTVCNGFTFIEGPIWNRASRYLTFNDIPVSKTYRYSESQGVSLLREDTHKANGNAYDLNGDHTKTSGDGGGFGVYPCRKWDFPY